MLPRSLLLELERLPSEQDRAHGREVLRDWLDLTADLDEAVVAMGHGLERGLAIVDRVLQYATLVDTDASASVLEMAPIIRDVIAQQREAVAQTKIQIELDIDRAGAVLGHVTEIEFVVSCLLRNAIEALAMSPQARPSQIRVACATVDGVTRLQVVDNGGGIRPEHQARIFEPFFSTKPAAGTGLGLAGVRKAVGVYDGSVAFETVPGGGSVFTVTLRGRVK